MFIEETSQDYNDGLFHKHKIRIKMIKEVIGGGSSN